MKELKATKREIEARLKLLNAQVSTLNIGPSRRASSNVQGGFLLKYGEAMKPEHVTPEEFLTYLANFHDVGQKNIGGNCSHVLKILAILTLLSRQSKGGRTSRGGKGH